MSSDREKHLVDLLSDDGDIGDLEETATCVSNDEEELLRIAEAYGAGKVPDIDEREISADECKLPPTRTRRDTLDEAESFIDNEGKLKYYDREDTEKFFTDCFGYFKVPENLRGNIAEYLFTEVEPVPEDELPAHLRTITHYYHADLKNAVAEVMRLDNETLEKKFGNS